MFTDDENVNKLLEHYRELLLEANKIKNLVSRNDVNNLTKRLITESLLPLQLDEDVVISPVLDIGSGGGLPGIPLKIAKPDIDITLLDANRNKTLILTRIVQELALTNVEIVWQRIENFIADKNHSGKFFTVLSRGLGMIDRLLDWSSIILKPGGNLIIWSNKSPKDLTYLPQDFNPPRSFPNNSGINLFIWKRKYN